MEIKFHYLEKDFAILEIKLRLCMDAEENLCSLQNEIKLLAAQLEEHLQPVKEFVNDHTTPHTISPVVKLKKTE